MENRLSQTDSTLGRIRNFRLGSSPHSGQYNAQMEPGESPTGRETCTMTLQSDRPPGRHMEFLRLRIVLPVYPLSNTKSRLRRNCAAYPMRSYYHAGVLELSMLDANRHSYHDSPTSKKDACETAGAVCLARSRMIIPHQGTEGAKCSGGTDGNLTACRPCPRPCMPPSSAASSMGAPQRRRSAGARGTSSST